MKKFACAVFIIAMIIFLINPLSSDVRGGSSSGGGPSGGHTPGGSPSGGYQGGGHSSGHPPGGAHDDGHYRGGDWHYNWEIGSFFWFPWWYYPYYYPYYSVYYPYYNAYEAEVAVPLMSQEYIDRTEPDKPVLVQSGVWYYCPESRAYYPYVKECPGSWQTVPVAPHDKPDKPASAQSGVWYYCPESRAYYPYVKECLGGWKMVPAQPSSETGR